MGPQVAKLQNRGSLDGNKDTSTNLVQPVSDAGAKSFPSLEATGKGCPGPPLCVCCKYSSPVKIEQMAPYLDVYPDKTAAEFLREGFTHGFKLGYLGEREARDSRNLKSVEKDPKTAREKLDKEIKLGRIAGPFKVSPVRNLIISPIGLVPKAEKGKFRLIQHLSHPVGTSINDGIDKNVCVVTYTKFDVAVDLVASVGRGACMAKADIESAFRLMPIHPDDFCLLGMRIENLLFLDKSLPMGASCSPAYFEKFSTFLEWVVRQEANTKRLIHYMDDYFCCGLADESSSSSCKYVLNCFEQVCAKLGVPLSAEKTVGPVTKLVFLGLEIDSVKQLVTVPQEKLVSIIDKIQKALKAQKLTLKELQSLVGSLSFICRAVPPGRAFLRRLIDLQIGVKQSWYKIHLSVGARADLNMWLIFLREYNGSTIFSDQIWVAEEDIQFFTDASGGIGFGGYYSGRWFQGRWPSRQFSQDHSIAWLEMFPIVVAIAIWGDKLQGKRIIMRCDNEAVVTIVNKQSSKCKEIMKLVRFLVLQCLKNNIKLSARHVPGKKNDVADSLSRFQMTRFWEVAPTAEREPTAVPRFLWDL